MPTQFPESTGFTEAMEGWSSEAERCLERLQADIRRVQRHMLFWSVIQVVVLGGLLIFFHFYP